MNKYLLDTHILLWSLLEPKHLSEKVVEELNDPANELWLSPITVWEIIILAEKGKIRLDRDPVSWMENVLETLPFHQAALNHAVAMQSRTIPLPHQDPADRFIAASAAVYDLTLVTSDKYLVESAKSYSVLPNLRWGAIFKHCRVRFTHQKHFAASNHFQRQTWFLPNLFLFVVHGMHLARLLGVRISAGRFIAHQDPRSRNLVCVLGSEAARRPEGLEQPVQGGGDPDPDWAPKRRRCHGFILQDQRDDGRTPGHRRCLRKNRRQPGRPAVGIVPVEIKLSAAVSRNALRGLENFIRDLTAEYGILINRE
jgi:PIN domain nuclease of toxin-antitoxin system